MWCPDCIATVLNIKTSEQSFPLALTGHTTAPHFVWFGTNYMLMRWFRGYHFGTQHMATGLCNKKEVITQVPWKI